MKKMFTSVFIICLVSLTIAQSKTTEASQLDISHTSYIRVATSYATGSNTSLYLFDPMNALQNQSFNATPSLGESILFNVGIGKMLTRNIGIEANFSYLHGLPINVYRFSATTSSGTTHINSEHRNKQFLFLPTSIFQVPLLQGKLTPYIKVGIIIPMMNETKMMYQIASEDKSITNQYEYQITNQLNLGINGCVGIRYKLSNHLSVFFEAEEDNIRSFHKTASLTKQSISGSVSGQEKMLPNYMFVDKTYTNSSPNEVLNFPVSYNREAYNLGLNYFF
ncbi:MAG: hypothetical protein MUE53_01525 [Chitinophagales bacterium]|jgi:hypothetical protein|nr:hypothetical protein [Chitinophagales bacterium]